MKDRIQLSDHFTYGRLIRFTLPSIGMMIFTSIYGVVDGFFVSNFAGKTPFAAVNLAWPFLMILSTVGLMFGTGGSAIVAKSFGEGDRDRANRCFSLFVYVAAAVGAVLAVLGIVFARPVIALLGGQGAMLENAVLYTASSCWPYRSTCCRCCFRPFVPPPKSLGWVFWSRWPRASQTWCWMQCW